MPSKKELEIERHSLLEDMATKIDFIYHVLSQATFETVPDQVEEEAKVERKNSKKTKKTK